MEFRTAYKVSKSEIRLSPEIPCLMFGSCFSDNIGKKMRTCLWNSFNPGGVLYNPISISKVIRLLLLEENPEKEFRKSLFYSRGKWHSWLFDSKISAFEKEDSIAEFNKRVEECKNMMKGGCALILTLGTAWCYSLNNGLSDIVSNCHKEPSSIFKRIRLTPELVSNALSELIKDLRNRYGKFPVIVTISPVRHLKDGFEGNSLSKAILRLGVEELSSNLGNIDYFPAFELLNDDLRDYRFYAEDMVHPSEFAVDYIWEKFRETFICQEGEKLLTEGERIVKGLAHRPLEDASKEENKDFAIAEKERILKLKKKYEILKKDYPRLLEIEFPD